MYPTKKLAIIGLGKMGISHLAIANATPGIAIAAVCDSSVLVGRLVEKYCKIPYFSDFHQVLEHGGLDAIVVATPTRAHESMIRAALELGLHIFCEKPLTLSAQISLELAALAKEKSVVTQVGYHNRFVATFAEAKRLIGFGAIGRVRHLHAEAYGPVVLKPQAKTWRSNSSEGGGCLYDYAAHPINLMNWYAGAPVSCRGSHLTQQYSTAVDDAVYANLEFAHGVSGQISVNWSDETVRKMTTKLTAWGDHGKIIVDRQELQLFISNDGVVPESYKKGWNIKYITELTPNVDYYLRGEEYSAQMADFRRLMANPSEESINSFSHAADTDNSLEMIRAAAARKPFIQWSDNTELVSEKKRSRWRLGRIGR